MSSHWIAEYRNTPLWSALASAIGDLAASEELSVNTAPEYVIEYLCRELIAKKVVIAPGHVDVTPSVQPPSTSP